MEHTEIINELYEECRYLERLLVETRIYLNSPMVDEITRDITSGKYLTWRAKYEGCLNSLRETCLMIQREMKVRGNVRFADTARIEKSVLKSLKVLRSGAQL
jgi:hypothetical protein